MRLSLTRIAVPSPAPLISEHLRRSASNSGLKSFKRIRHFNPVTDDGKGQFRPPPPVRFQNSVRTPVTCPITRRTSSQERAASLEQKSQRHRFANSSTSG